MTHTLVIGEALVDAVAAPGQPVREHVGGSPANVAFGLAALTHDVDLATWIADDDRGRRIAAVCAERGVALTAGSDGARFTSVAHATLDGSGAATYRFDLDWQLAAVPDLAQYAHVHTGSIAAVLAPGGSAVRDAVAAARPTATISYDPNARPSLMGEPAEARRVIEGAIAMADVVKVSDEDIAWLHPGASVEDVLARWAALGPAVIVATRGGDGAIAHLSRTGDVHHFRAPSVEVVDTVGAGDSFMAGLVSGLLDAGLLGGPTARERLAMSDLPDFTPAIERALATAARTVSVAGAHSPTRSDLRLT